MVSICFSPSCTPVCVCMVASDNMITARVLYVYVCVPKLHYISSYMKITFNKFYIISLSLYMQLCAFNIIDEQGFGNVGCMVELFSVCGVYKDDLLL